MQRKLHSENKFDARLNGQYRYCFGDSPPPDPNLGISSKQMADVAREQLDFNREVYREGQPRQASMDRLASKLATQQMDMADESRGRATELWDRWKAESAPLESEFTDLARNAGGEADQEQAASTAAADVAQAEEVARGTQERNLLSLGVNPNSGKFAAAKQGLSLVSAANRASAMNTARRSAVDRGLTLKSSAINIGRGLPALGLSSDQLALSGGNSAGANSQVGNNLMMSRVAGLNQGYNNFQSGIGNAYDASSAQHQSAVNATGAKNQQTGQIVGTIATSAAAYF